MFNVSVNLGVGVYFYTNASDAINKQCSGSGTRYLYCCTVLTGTYTKGAAGIKEPPPRDSKNKLVLHDSVVDDASSPTVYVAFKDHQCYPDYLITFT